MISVVKAFFITHLAQAFGLKWTLEEEVLQPQREEFFRDIEHVSGGARVHSLVPINQAKCKLDKWKHNCDFQDPSMDFYVLFHGTDEASARNICEEGIQPSRAKRASRSWRASAR